VRGGDNVEGGGDQEGKSNDESLAALRTGGTAGFGTNGASYAEADGQDGKEGVALPSIHGDGRKRPTGSAATTRRGPSMRFGMSSRVSSAETTAEGGKLRRVAVYAEATAKIGRGMRIRKSQKDRQQSTWPSA